MFVDSVIIDPLLKAFSKFEKFRQKLETEQDRAGAIQAFEYCFELSWKIMKKLLEQRGRTAYSPKEVFRMAVLEKFIDDPEIWFNFLHRRNLTVHTYQEDIAGEVIEIFPQFSLAVQDFLATITPDLVEPSQAISAYNACENTQDQECINQ